MTTNIYDIKNKIIAYDSRWSIDDEKSDYILYSDETNFKKLVSFGDSLMVFAGYLEPINNWLLWVVGGMKNADKPSTDGVSLVIISADGDIVDRVNLIPYRSLEDVNSKTDFSATFAGSGLDFALPKWDRIRRTRRASNITAAIKFAAEHDIYTGGELTTKNLLDVNHDDHCCTPCNYAEFNRVFLETGYIYMKDTGLTVKYKMADESVKLAVNAMSNGSLLMNVAAPFDGMDKKHTEEESNEITSRIRSYFLKKGVIKDV
jgi:hypothetical protein